MWQEYTVCCNTLVVLAHMNWVVTKQYNTYIYSLLIYKVKGDSVGEEACERDKNPSSIKLFKHVIYEKKKYRKTKDTSYEGMLYFEVPCGSVYKQILVGLGTCYWKLAC